MLHYRVLILSFLLLNLAGLGTALGQTFTFNTPGSFSWTVPTYSGPAPGPGESLVIEIEVIIVGAGGGGGRGNGAGGGGGGAVITTTFTANQGDTFTGVIGSGGAGGTAPNGAGSNGSASSFNGNTANGGSGGGGGDAGSGGASGSGQAGGFGSFSDSRSAGGGGGGANSSGTNGTTPNPRGIGGNGGQGLLGYGGGGGGAGRGQGQGNNNQPGIGQDGGTPGSIGTASNAINGGGGGGGITAGGNGGNGVVVINVIYILPVDYLYFDAKYSPTFRSGDLTWATAKEWENDRFEIERSVNDVTSWETIGQVAGAGYSDQPVEYTYQDMKLPLAGGNIFYRLKQFDFDGSFAYSDTKGIRVAPMAGTTHWKVYPNPSTGDPVNLEILDRETYRDEKITVRVISAYGQNEVFESQSLTSLSSQLSELLRGKAAGIYMLEINWGIQREYHKVILRR